jgi:hypothetical protein
MNDGPGKVTGVCERENRTAFRPSVELRELQTFANAIGTHRIIENRCASLKRQTRDIKNDRSKFIRTTESGMTSLGFVRSCDSVLRNE